MAPGNARRNLSLGKAFRIIESMAEAGGPLRLKDIAARVGVPPSTALRFLGTLIELGYARHDEHTQQYCFTMRFAGLAHMVGRQLPFREVVRPYLFTLSSELRESTSLAVEEGLNVVYVDVADGPDHMLQTLQRIGKIAPMHATGVGKVLLADFRPARLDEYLRVKGLPSMTCHTIHARRTLMTELERIRARGFAMDQEECELGVRCVAAPIRDFTGRVVAACSVSGPVVRMTPARIDILRRRIVATAVEISKRLGHAD